VGILFLFLNSISNAQATHFPSIQELITLFNIRHQDFASLEKNHVMPFKITENHEKELAAASVMYLTASPEKVISFIKLNGMTSIEADVTLKNVITPDSHLESFKEFTFGNNKEESSGLISAKPGDLFNLSSEEYRFLRESIPENQRSASNAAKIYRELLEQRWQNYRANGLRGIATYDRGSGKTADPGNELLDAALNHSVLVNFFPELHEVWLNYPGAISMNTDDTSEKYFLINRLVQNRPTAVLVHRVIHAKEEGAIILSRQFYVGHSYNSNQITLICLPYLNGTILFYLSQSFTDQITGFGSSLKRPIGREQMRRRMDNHLKELSNALN